MKFELGKCYKHTTGGTLYVCGHADSVGWGAGLVAEFCRRGEDPQLIRIGSDADSAANYTEIPKQQFIDENYSND